MTEDKLLSQCHKWLWNTYSESRYCCWHVANERITSPVQGARLKAKGVISGVPDYVINHKNKVYYIEFKSETGKLSDNQFAVIQALANQNINTFVCCSLEHFKQIINSIYEP